jgi:hypothetical protein
MLARVQPYLPTPRLAAPDLGRRPAGTPLGRAGRFALHLVGILAFTAVPVLCAWAAIHFLLESDWLVVLRATGFIVFAALAFVYLKSLLPRRMPTPPAAIPILPADQPAAYEFIARVAEEIGSRPPRRIWIGSGTELALRGRRSLASLVRHGPCDIEVGLWLWHGLSLSEFRALIARTLAPTSRGWMERTRFEARALLKSLVGGRDFLDEFAETDAALSAVARLVSATHRIAIAPVRALGRVLLRLAAHPPDALADDLVAVRICGSDALVHAILRADFAGATLDELDRMLTEAARDGFYTSDAFAHSPDAATLVREAHNDFTLGETPTLRGPSAGKYADVFEPDQSYLSDVWSGFPAPSAREQNAKRMFVACERDERPARELIDDPHRLRERLTNLRYDEVYGLSPGIFTLSPTVIARWMRTHERPAFSGRYNGVYDGGRPIDPGTPKDRDAALLAESWDEARLVSTAGRLYAQAGERAACWRTARAGLEKVLRRTLGRPSGRDRAMADDLEDELRRVGRWLAALDRWAFVTHIHMAVRLPDLARHNELLDRYDSILQFQPLAVDAREYRNRVAAFVRLLDQYSGLPPIRLRRDAGHEFRASRRDLELLLKEAAEFDDSLIREQIGDIRLDRFLFAQERLPFREQLPVSSGGRRILRAWDQVVAKAQWLHSQMVAALLDLHERVENEYRLQVGPLPALAEEALRDAIVIDEKSEELTIDHQPDVVELEFEPKGNGHGG